MDPSKDHRAIGNRLGLFSFHDDAPGMVFWHARGWLIFRKILEYLRGALAERGYDEVCTPQLCARSLWEQSGHWEAFTEGMYRFDYEEQWVALKPVSCPAHLRIFNKLTRSYRELPLRMAEFGCCHRHEPSGSLHGILRLRQFTQDDAHIFCTEEQAVAEVVAVAELVANVYRAFGVGDVAVRFATRPEERLGSEAAWDRAEAVLADAARAARLDPEPAPGEGAFYGPKLEFSIRDAFGRQWQCGTAQLDLILPERMNAEYSAADGSRRRPVMVHRAILGSVERFLAILLEHYEGVLPLWLAPIQLALTAVSESSEAYADELERELRASGVRVARDRQNDGVARKVVRAREQGAPLVWVVGERERQAQAVSIRDRSGQIRVLSKASAIAGVAAQAQTPRVGVTDSRASLDA